VFGGTGDIADNIRRLREAASGDGARGRDMHPEREETAR
jgi:hypothetical protein